MLRKKLNIKEQVKVKAPLEPELRRCLNEETNTRWSQPYDDLKEGQFRLRQMQMQSP